MRVLIIERDAALSNFLARGLGCEGYEVEVCQQIEQASPRGSDLIVLDFHASAQEALRMIQAIQGQAPSVLVIGLGARLPSAELVEFLDAGADDYMAKPFSFAELAARIRALHRRSRRSADTVLTIGDLTMDRVRRRVERAGRTIELTTKEFTLLEFLMLNAGRRVSRGEILGHVWKCAALPRFNKLSGCVHRLHPQED
jgi:DNA-binding response OmpR family regulator